MEHRNGLAGNLVDAVAKEATAQVAKGVVGVVKVIIAALVAAIVALAYTLWSANPLATVALLLLSFLLGLAIGIAFGWRRAYGIKSERRAAMDSDELPGAARGAAIGSAEGPSSELPTESEGRGAGTVVPGLTPIETEMAFEVYRAGALRVGTEWFQVAKLLRSRGVIYRLDAPSSGVIEECDVALTDEWRDKVGDAYGAGSTGPLPAQDSEEDEYGVSQTGI